MSQHHQPPAHRSWAEQVRTILQAAGATITQLPCGRYQVSHLDDLQATQSRTLPQVPAARNEAASACLMRLYAIPSRTRSPGG